MRSLRRRYGRALGPKGRARAREAALDGLIPTGFAMAGALTGSALGGPVGTAIGAAAGGLTGIGLTAALEAAGEEGA